MLISQYVSGVSPDFTLTRAGDQVTATLFYGLTGYYDEELGYYLWNGEIYYNIGAEEAYVFQDIDRPMDLEYTATLAAATPTVGGYTINDYNGNSPAPAEFYVTIFDTAGDFIPSAQADYVFGSDFADTFRSKGAGDIFEGGLGDDNYRVYDAGTKIHEGAGEGTADRVLAGISFALDADVAIELLTTTSGMAVTDINLTGNALRQEIIGSNGANILHDGGNGEADILRGLAGNDTYRVYNSGDVIVEGASQGDADRVHAAVDYGLGAGVHVEIMQTNSMTGKAAIDLAGNEFSQAITGNAGANILNGKGAADVLRGLGGADTFVFDSPLGGGNIDRIVDFDPSADTILLDKAVFTQLPGTLLPGHFRSNTTGLAQDASDRIIYDSNDGKLFYDADGIGGAAGIRFGTISTGLALNSSDFAVV